jgi:hypothetical protein
LLRRQISEVGNLSGDARLTAAQKAALAKLRASNSLDDALSALDFLRQLSPAPEILSELAQIMKANRYTARTIGTGGAIAVIAGDESPKLDAAFRPLLQDSDPQIRYGAAYALAQVLKGKAGLDVIRVAVEELKSADDNVRVGGLTTLQNSGEDPKMGTSRVTTASLGPAAGEATAALLDIAKNSQRTDVRDSALAMLHGLNPDLTQMDPALQESFKQSQQMTDFIEKVLAGQASRAEIIEGLKQFPKAAPKVAPLLDSRGHDAQ